MLLELTRTLNLVKFASAYYVSTGELKHRKQEVIITTFPSFSPNPLGKNYGNYCKHAPIKYKPWSGSEKSISNGMELTIAMEIRFDATMHFLPLKMPLG